jgi:simple sugar transport system substrate-binding protein
MNEMHRRGFLTGMVAAAAGGLLAPMAASVAFATAAGQKPGEGMQFRLNTHGGYDPFWTVVKQGMTDAADLFGCKAEIDLAGSDLASQQRMFQEAVVSKADGIAVVINDDDAWDKPVEDALAAGIPIIGINNDDTKGPAGNKRLCYIGQDTRRAGYIIGYKLFSAGKDRGIDLAQAHVCVAAEVPTANYAVTRSAGIKDAMAEFGITSFEMIGCGDYEMTPYLEAHPETTFMMGAGGVCTNDLASSLKTAGKAAGEVIAGGFDVGPGTVEGLKSGYVLATIDQQQYLQGYFAVAVLVLCKLYGLTPNIDTGGYLIIKDNLGLIEELSGKYR